MSFLKVATSLLLFYSMIFFLSSSLFLLLPLSLAVAPSSLPCRADCSLVGQHGEADEKKKEDYRATTCASRT